MLSSSHSNIYLADASFRQTCKRVNYEVNSFFFLPILCIQRKIENISISKRLNFSQSLRVAATKLHNNKIKDLKHFKC